MIQDILTYSAIVISLVLMLRSFIRFFTVRTQMSSMSQYGCGSCDKSCPMKSVMTGINQLAIEK